MTARGAALQGGLAACGLLLAYGTWQREPERAAGEVVLLEATKNEVQKVRYEDGTRATDVERGRRDDEPKIWVRVSASADGKIPARSLRGGEAAEKLLGEFAPLRATRALGVLDAAKRKELGFDTSKKKVKVWARGEQRSFAISSQGFGGTYWKDDRDGRVYLTTATLMGDLESAGSRLVDRRLHEFLPADYDAVTIKVGPKRRELTVLQSTPAGVRLAGRLAPGKADELASNWSDKVWRLVPIELLGTGEQPAVGAPELVVRVEYAAKGKPKGWIELGRTQAAAPSSMSSAEPPKPDVYARSEHSVGWIKLPMNADDVLKEADKVVAAE